MTNTTWFEVINDEGDWWKFDTVEEAKSFFDEMDEQGENVSLQKPTADWDEDNNSYEEIESNFDFVS